MKDGVRILNFARGELVVGADMAEAVKAGKVAAYVTDFPSDEVIGVENVTALPHLGASTPESEENCAYMAAVEIREFLEKGNIKNSVNFPACDLGVCHTPGRIGVLHKNVPSVISGLTNACGQAGVNIEKMINQSRGEYAYSLMDISKAEAYDICFHHKVL